MDSFPILKKDTILRNDRKRAIIYTKNGHNEDIVKQAMIKELPQFSTLSPVLAVVLSMMDGTNSFDEIIKTATEYFKLNNACWEQHAKLLNEDLRIYYDLLHKAQKKTLPLPDIEKILPDLGQIDKYDLSSSYLYYPHSFLLIPHMKCNVSCIYCYADRKTPYELLNIKEWIDFINRLVAEYQPKDISISGGDIFLYPDWRKLLTAITQNGYFPELPTKSALDRDEQQFLSDLGFKSYQISLDSLAPQVIEKHLKLTDADEYCACIVKSIETAAQVGLKISINSIQTKFSVETIYDTAKQLLKYDNIYRYAIDSAGYSHYLCEEMETVMLDEDSKLIMQQQMDMVRQDFYNPARVFLKLNTEPQVYGSCQKMSEEEYWQRSFCSGGRTALIVLPDGGVTCCEELYWQKHYLLGNIKTDTLENIFLSEKRWDLLQPKQEEQPVTSPCRYCPNDIFIKCTREKGRCWRESLKAFSRIDYPDIRCPFWQDKKTGHDIQHNPAFAFR